MNSTSKLKQVLFLFIIILFTGQKAWATKISVTTDKDGVSKDGFCTLDEAVENANQDSAIYADCAAGSGTDTIVLTSGKTYKRSAALEIDKSLIIQTTIPTSSATIEQHGFDRVVDVDTKDVVNLVLTDVQIAGGELNSSSSSSCVFGAGIYFEAGAGSYLSLNRTTVSDNTINCGNGMGAGIDFEVQDGNLYVNSSTISWNTINASDCHVAAYGAGIAVWNGSKLWLYNSTVAFNTIESCSSTIGYGAGVSISATSKADIEYSTISYNTVLQGVGGGIYLGGVSNDISIKAVILAGNTASYTYDTGTIVNVGSDCFGSGTNLKSYGYNFYTGTSGPGIHDCIFASAANPGTDVPNIPFSMLQLSKFLAPNGGQTETLSLGLTSPARDQADCRNIANTFSVTTDQRLKRRDAKCDIGAYEYSGAVVGN